MTNYTVLLILLLMTFNTGRQFSQIFLIVSSPVIC